jgi:hypothetical protein
VALADLNLVDAPRWRDYRRRPGGRGRDRGLVSIIATTIAASAVTGMIATTIGRAIYRRWDRRFGLRSALWPVAVSKAAHPRSQRGESNS